MKAWLFVLLAALSSPVVAVAGDSELTPPEADQAAAPSLPIMAVDKDSAPKPLKADQAAVVGGWSGAFSKSRLVQGLELDKVSDDGGCLKYGASVLWLRDKLDSAPVGLASTLKPGRYVLAGTAWSERWIDPYEVTGVSRPDGDAWVVDIAPGVVTDLGVWPITSPYTHRFIPGPPTADRPSPGAEAAAKAVEAPLVPAHWTRVALAEGEDACPAAATK